MSLLPKRELDEGSEGGGVVDFGFIVFDGTDHGLD